MEGRQATVKGNLIMGLHHSNEFESVDLQHRSAATMWFAWAR
ncbi:hypothetical protein ANO14919_069840 [Xylariales sp. No.14919]|nr:hypothetical protein ANO14919_069840 [Xylariales sp. No.14919]